MKKNNKNKAPGFDQFRRYLKGEMTGIERNAFERQLQKDSFSEEALEGLETIFPGDSVHDINMIRSRIRARSTRKYTIYRIAATITVLMIISSVFIVLEKDEPQKDSFISEEKILEIDKSEPIKAPETLQQKKIQSDYIASEKSTTSARVYSSEKESVLKEERFEGAAGELPAAAAEKPLQDKAVQLEDENLYAAVSVKIITGAEAKKSEAEEEATQPAGQTDTRILRRNKATLQDLPANYVRTIPSFGDEAFIKFLMDSLRKSNFLEPGEIYSATVLFKVSSDGSLDSLRAVKSSDKRFSDEVIRLIGSGPAWTPAMSGGTSIDEEVTVIIEYP